MKFIVFIFICLFHFITIKLKFFSSFFLTEMKALREKRKICKSCNNCAYGKGNAEPELVKIDRIKLKKVPMPVDHKTYKKMTQKGSGKSRFKSVSNKYTRGYSFQKPMVDPEPEILALPEPEIYSKKQLVSYDYQYREYPNYVADYYDYPIPNITTIMAMMTTTTTPAPSGMVIAPAAFVTFPPVNTGKRK